jgi:archaellum component FlaC
MSPLIRNVLCVSEHELLEIAFSSIGIKPEHIGNDLIQGGGGFRVFKLREKYRSNLVAMNQQAEKIYQRLAPVSHDELPNLRSMEVTVKTMVEQIASTLIDKKLAIENEIKKLKKEMKKLKSDDYNDVKSLKYNALERELRELKIQVLEQKIVVASNNDDPIELQSLEYQLSYLKEIPIPTAESEAEKRRIEINTQLDSLDNRKAELRQSLKYICIVLDVLEAEHLQQQQPKEQTSIRGRQAFFPSSDHISTQVMRGKEDEENNSPPI